MPRTASPLEITAFPISPSAIAETTLAQEVPPARGVVTVLIAVLAVIAMIVGPAATARADELTPTEGAELQLLDLINGARAEVGAESLVLNDELTDIARAWSEEMHAAGELSHNPSYAEQYSGSGVMAENVGHFAWPRGELTRMVEIMHEAFMDSAGHRRNIERARFNQVGIGVVHRDGLLWVTVNFLDGPLPGELHDAPADQVADQAADQVTEQAAAAAGAVFHRRR